MAMDLLLLIVGADERLARTHGIGGHRHSAAALRGIPIAGIVETGRPWAVTVLAVAIVITIIISSSNIATRGRGLRFLPNEVDGLSPPVNQPGAGAAAGAASSPRPALTAELAVPRLEVLPVDLLLATFARGRRG